MFNNKGNIQSPENFNPPTQHDAYMDGKPAGTCLVHDAAAWRNKNRYRTERSAPKKNSKPDTTRKSLNSFDNPIPGRV